MKAQKDALAVKIQKYEAIEKSKKRKQDTRRKILIGAYYLEKAIESNTMEEINKIMDGYLKRDIDRKLFNLSAIQLENNEKTPKPKEIQENTQDE